MNTQTKNTVPDYGEPWTYESFNVSLGETGDYEGVALLRTRHGHLVAEKHDVDDIDEDHLRRAAQCVNACAGMADPAARLANLNAIIEQQAEMLQSAVELIRRVSTGPATPNDAWQWLKQRGLDEYKHINPDRKSHDQHA